MGKREEVRAAGYRWALEHPSNDPIYANIGNSDYPDPDLVQFETLYGVNGASFEDFKRGIADARVVMGESELLSTNDIAQGMNFDVSYVRAEVAAKRLKTLRFEGRDHVIHPSDFAEWARNPRRGTRTKEIR
jgi:hypothetical protein